MSDTQLADVTARLQRLEDIEAIQRLKADYVAASDRGYDADALAEMFAVDGVWDGGPFGRYEGRETIREWIRGIPDGIPFAKHYVMAPNIQLSLAGDEATAVWQIFMTAEMTNEDGSRDAVLMIGGYDERLAKIDGTWQLKHVTMTVDRLCNLDQGWVDQPMRA